VLRLRLRLLPNLTVARRSVCAQGDLSMGWEQSAAAGADGIIMWQA